MAAIAYQNAKAVGTALTFGACAGGGDTAKATDRGVLIFKNGDGTSTTVTMVVPGSDKYEQARPDVAISVAAGAEVAVGPLPSDLADPTTGNISFTYSKVTSLTVAAFTV